MSDSQGRQVASKWLKTKALLSDPGLAKHIPDTCRYKPSNLRAMLSRYAMVVVKPVRGAGGIGVMMVKRQRRAFTCTYLARTKRYSNFSALSNAIDKRRKGSSFLIQTGIHLARIKGRPVDYRVKYVKENDEWTYRSMVGRLAKKGLFVTNLCRGGELMPSAEAIRRSLSSKLVREKKREMRHLTETSTTLLERRFPGVAQLGYDYGIDRKGHIWLLEVNTRPQ
ncbi:hypothetical protein SD71_09240 [Cohnella kolymensis]|uniref:YheC/YheD family protein n=1 Tax=Cohnella kolymensis TaxID=1590652 RepID=A0ABR5A5A1_9BACL|nr:YheC/YheD family protein [Cohnella kolymensis]KIL36241.1 hypothetical protein SD71_09240 [Cohnella kolymensis]